MPLGNFRLSQDRGVNKVVTADDGAVRVIALIDTEIIRDHLRCGKMTSRESSAFVEANLQAFGRAIAAKYALGDCEPYFDGSGISDGNHKLVIVRPYDLFDIRTVVP